MSKPKTMILFFKECQGMRTTAIKKTMGRAIEHCQDCKRYRIHGLPWKWYDELQIVSQPMLETICEDCLGRKIRAKDKAFATLYRD